MPFSIIRNDITKVAADAIVNTANPQPVIGAGTDSAIYKAAGAELLLAERRKIGAIHPGEAAVTPAFALPAKYIIHTVGPAWRGGEAGEFETLASCYRKSLLLAKQLGCESVAFPLISTGTYGFPKDKALSVAMEEIEAFLQDDDLDVTLTVLNKEAFTLSRDLLDDVQSYIDDRTAELLHQAEYSASYSASFDSGMFGADMVDERRSSAMAPPTSAQLMPQAAPQSGSMPELQESAPSGQQAGPQSRPRKGKGLFGKLASIGKKTADAALPKEPQAPEEAYEDAAALLIDSDEERIDFQYSAKMSYPEAAKEALAKANAVPTAGAAVPAAGVAVPSAVTLSAESLPDRMAHLGDTFQERLLRLIDAQDLTDPEVYKKANLDRKLFSKIRSNAAYRPSKNTVLALAIALELDLTETKDLLARAGFAFSPSSKFDLIVQYCFEKRIYDIFEVNALLFQYDQPLLGAS